ncbi:MAG: surface lipoprotein assembly modifier [Pseudorhodobacter sp.]
MRSLIALLMLVLMPLCANAQGVEAAERAIAAGRISEGVALAEAARPANSSEEIRRLWALAVGYGRQGRPRAAIAPLERLVALQPADPRWRLELAGALAETGQDERAGYHFDLARGAQGLAAPTRKAIDDHIDRLDRRQTWEGHFRLSIVPESNAEKRTGAERVTIGGLNFGINPNARQRPATGLDIGFGLTALPVIAPDLRGQVGFRVEARLFDGRAADDVTLRVGAGLIRFADHGQRLSAEMFATRRWLADRAYTRAAGLELGYSRRLSERVNLGATLLADRTDYTGTPFHADRAALHLNALHVVSPQLMLRGGLRFETRRSANPGLAGQASGLSLGGQYLFAGGMRVALDLHFDRNDFEGRHALFGVQRQDRRRQAILQVTNANWNYLGFAPVLKLGYDRQKSSIVLNDYRNLSAAIGITRSF